MVLIVFNNYKYLFYCIIEVVLGIRVFIGEDFLVESYMRFLKKNYLFKYVLDWVVRVGR